MFMIASQYRDLIKNFASTCAHAQEELRTQKYAIQEARNLISSIEKYKDLSVGDIVDEINNEGHVIYVDYEGLPNVWFVFAKDSESGSVIFARAVCRKVNSIDFIRASDKGYANFVVNRAALDHYLLTGDKLDPFEYYRRQRSYIKGIDVRNKKRRVLLNHPSVRANFNKLKRLLPDGQIVWVSENDSEVKKYIRGTVHILEVDFDECVYNIEIVLDDGDSEVFDLDDFGSDNWWEIYIEEPEKY